MNLSRNQNKKGGFDLSKFYQDLSRVENSLGKPAARKTASSLTKNVQTNKHQQDRVQNLESFKKELANKTLAKGKIQISQYEKVKISKTQNQQKSNESRIQSLSQIQRQQAEDPWQDLRGKLQSWSTFDKDGQFSKTQQCHPNSKTANKSHLYFERKDEGVYQNLQVSSQIPRSESHNSPSSVLQASLQAELQRRNKIYKTVQKGIKIERSYYKKEAADLSIKLKQHIRESELMKEIIQHLKQVCGLQVSDLRQLYALLRSESAKASEQRQYSRDSAVLGQK